MRVYNWNRDRLPVPGHTLVNLHVDDRTMFGRARNFLAVHWKNADWYSVVRHGDD